MSTLLKGGAWRSYSCFAYVRRGAYNGARERLKLSF
jgi:hypothetical protein